MIFDRLFAGFIWIWLVAVALLLGATVIFTFAQHGWAAVPMVLEWFNPFNIAGFIVNILTLSPAIFAFMWREKRRERSVRR
jgi:hypothetical protein